MWIVSEDGKLDDVFSSSSPNIELDQFFLFVFLSYCRPDWDICLEAHGLIINVKPECCWKLRFSKCDF